MREVSSAAKIFIFSIGVALSALLFAPVAKGQVSTVTPRITERVDESARVALHGNVTPMARAEFDRGQASAGTPLQFLHLVLSRSPEQQAALDQLIEEQQEPASPNYHHWLSPQEFGQRFGAADSDIAALRAWLESHGFQVSPISPSRTGIDFSGTVGQVQEAFHTSIHTFQAEGAAFLSNVSDPEIPAALSRVIGGVVGLNTIPLRPFSHVAGAGRLDPETHRLVLNSMTGTAVHPAYYDSGSKSLLVVPADAATIYDTPTSLNVNATGTKYDGTGVTIGVIGNSGIGTGSSTPTAPIVNYRTTFLGNSTAPIITNVDGTTTAGDYQEAYLDLEVSGGLAPGATIHFYTASDGSLVKQIHQALTDNKVDILSVSFGLCEKLLGSSGNLEYNSDWSQAATQGISVVVSTGDNGSAGCDNTQTSNGNVTTATQGLAVNGLASTPYNIGVGGTDYYPLVQSFSQYVSTTNSASNYYRSVNGYIPESPWNDSSLTFPPSTISADTPLTSNSQYSSYANIVAGSGGVSSCSSQSTSGTTTTCTGGYAKPSWQRGTGVPGDGVRDLPDVSLLAGNGFYGATWLVCTSDTVTGGSTNCSSLTGGEGTSFLGIGGTSAAAPAFAGMLALVQQSQGASNRLGLAAKTLYDVFYGSHASAAFHDVTIGNNAVPCTSGSPNCAKNSAGYYFLTGYNTNAGFDLATGIGSVDVSQLISYWSSATGSTAPTVSVTPSATTIAANQSLTLAVTVSGSAGTPTGTVSVSGGGYTSSSQSLTSGAYTFTIPANSLTVGTDTLTVTYNGDSTYSTGTKTVQIVVTAAPTATVTITPASSTIVSSQALSVPITVSGNSGTATGTVTLSSGSYTSAVTTLVSGAATITIPANTLAVGTDTLKASYSGDGTYAATSSTVTVTVNAPYSMTATTPSAISKGGTATSTISVKADATYTGTLSLACALTSSPSGAVDLPTCTVSSGASITVTAGTASPSTATVTMTTTAAQASLQPHNLPPWLGGGSGAVLALLVFFGIPARRRSWRNLVGLLVVFAALGSMTACGGGGGGSSSSSSTKDPGTSSGTYVFTVTATGNPGVTPAPTTTVNLTVN